MLETRIRIWCDRGSWSFHISRPGKPGEEEGGFDTEMKAIGAALLECSPSGQFSVTIKIEGTGE